MNHSAEMTPALRLLLAFLAIGSCIAADNIDLWPMPKTVSHGTQKLCVNIVVHTTEDEVTCLFDLTASPSIDWIFHLSINILHLVHLLQLNFGADESYNLTVPTTGDPM